MFPLWDLDESIGKIEVDPKEAASVVEVFQDVLDKISDVEKKDKLLKFFKLVFGFWPRYLFLVPDSCWAMVRNSNSIYAYKLINL